MFNNEILKKSAELASQFKMPYLVPLSTEPCNYCQLLKKYPSLTGTHAVGCKIKKSVDEWKTVRNKPGCRYCNELTIFPRLVGTHSPGCCKYTGHSRLGGDDEILRELRQNPIIDPNTGEKMWIE